MASFIFSITSIYGLIKGPTNTIQWLLIILPVILFILAVVAGTIAHNLRWAFLASSVTYCAWGYSTGIIIFPIILLIELGMDGVKFVLYSIGGGIFFFLITRLLKKPLLNQKMQSTQNDAQAD